MSDSQNQNSNQQQTTSTATSTTSESTVAPKRRQRVECAPILDARQKQQQEEKLSKEQEKKKEEEGDDQEAAEFEAAHVHDVYSSIAQKFSDTRYKPWPKVLEFVLQTPPGGILLDVGCGNGKNMGRLPASSKILELGCDRSVELLSIAATQRKLPVVACDMLQIPFRPGCADRVICIAVLHHLATAQRRLNALRQMFKLLRPGSGRMLIYVWSTAFAKTELKKGRADPAVLSQLTEEEEEKQEQEQQDEENAKEREEKQQDNSSNSNSNNIKGADVFVSFQNKSHIVEEQPPTRFYHLFEKGEAEALCSQIAPEAEVVNSWFDTENWAVEVAHRGNVDVTSSSSAFASASA